MKYIRKFDGAAAMAAAIASLPRPFVAWDGVAEENINLNFGEPTEAPTTTTEAPTTTTEAPVTVDYTEPFYIEDISGSDNTIQIKKSGSDAPTLTIEKSTDGVNWTEWGQTSTTAISATVPANGKLYLRCSATKWSKGISNYNYFNSASGDFNVGGNIMSLLYGSNFTGEETTFPSGSTYTFSYLFSENTHIISTSKLLLPAKPVDYCYYYMFSFCSKLTAAPELPSTILAQYCYQNMFQGCTALATAPELPATTLAKRCYQHMFLGCSSLTTAPELPATTLATYCYSSMFKNCTALTAAPTLPATTLAAYCYQNMFNGCTNLNYIKCLATNIQATSCINGWTNGVAASGTFIKNPNMSTSTWGTGVNGIPSGWTVQDAA